MRVVIDPQKAYDSVDRELLCEVLTPFSVPTKMLTIVLAMSTKACARVLTDDGEHSKWFDVTRGLGQSCVLSPSLFNVFFAAALHVVLVRFSKDEAMVRQLVRRNIA